MPSFLLHIPAWFHQAEGDRPPRVIRMGLRDLPREGSRIEVANGGVVEVSRVVHRPQWRDEYNQATVALPGGNYESLSDLPEIYTCWAVRPEGAPKTRRIDPHA